MAGTDDEEEATLKAVCQMGEAEAEEWRATVSESTRARLLEEASQLTTIKVPKGKEDPADWFVADAPAGKNERTAWLMIQFFERIGSRRTAGDDDGSAGGSSRVEAGGLSLTQLSAQFALMGGDSAAAQAAAQNFTDSTAARRAVDSEDLLRRKFDPRHQISAEKAPDKLVMNEISRKALMSITAVHARFGKQQKKDISYGVQSPEREEYRLLAFGVSQARFMFNIARNDDFRIKDKDVAAKIADAASHGAVDEMEEGSGGVGPLAAACYSATRLLAPHVATARHADEPVESDDVAKTLGNRAAGPFREQEPLLGDLTARLKLGQAVPRKVMRQCQGLIKAAMEDFLEIGDSLGVCLRRIARNKKQLEAFLKQLDAVVEEGAYERGYSPEDLAVSGVFILLALTNYYVYTLIKQKPPPLYLDATQRERLVAALRRKAPTWEELRNAGAPSAASAPPAVSPTKRVQWKTAAAAGKALNLPRGLIGVPRAKKSETAKRDYARCAAYAAEWVNGGGTFRDSGLCTEAEYDSLDGIYLSYHDFDFERTPPKQLKTAIQARKLVAKYDAFVATMRSGAM